MKKRMIWRASLLVAVLGLLAAALGPRATGVAHAATTSQLISNGGFESGASPWAETSAGGYQLIGTSTPHTGTHAAWLCGYTSCSDTLAQTITLPSSLSSVTMTFWLDEMAKDTSCTGSLRVLLKTTSGTTLATPFSRCSSSSTGGYVQQTVSLSSLLAYGGQAVQIVVADTATNATNYFLDDVSVLATTSSGGVPTSTSVATATDTATATNTVTVSKTSTPAATATNTVPSGGPSQLVANSGFESGQSPWVETSAGGYQLITTTRAHTGTHSAWLCGYKACNDTIGQTITLPGSFSSLTMSFWLEQSLPDTTCSGTLKVLLETASGTTIATPFSRCSSSATSGWAQQTLSLASQLHAYAGQKVHVIFAGTTGSSTNYFIDDVLVISG